MFYYAAEVGDIQTVKSFVYDSDVDINHTDRHGESVLHVATAENQKDVVELLLERHDLDETVRSKDNILAIDLAQSCGHHDIVAKIVSFIYLLINTLPVEKLFLIKMFVF